MAKSQVLQVQLFNPTFRRTHVKYNYQSKNAY